MDPSSVCARAPPADPADPADPAVEDGGSVWWQSPPKTPYPGDGMGDRVNIFPEDPDAAPHATSGGPTRQYVRREALKEQYGGKELKELFDDVATANKKAEGACAGSPAAVHAEDMTWLLALDVRCAVANNRSESDETDADLPGLLATRYATDSTALTNFVFT